MFSKVVRNQRTHPVCFTRVKHSSTAGSREPRSENCERPGSWSQGSSLHHCISLSPFFSPLLPLFSHVLIWMFGYFLLLSFVLHNMPICEPLFFYMYLLYTGETSQDCNTTERLRILEFDAVAASIYSVVNFSVISYSLTWGNL